LREVDAGRPKAGKIGRGEKCCGPLLISGVWGGDTIGGDWKRVKGYSLGPGFVFTPTKSGDRLEIIERGSLRP